MKPKEINKEAEEKTQQKWNKAEWERIEPKDDCDVIKINVSDVFMGYLREAIPSEKYKFIYKFEVENDKRLKIICGTTDLIPRMNIVKVGDYVGIERTQDIPQPGHKNPLEKYEVHRRRK